MLTDAQSELIEKDNEISRLTKEIVELRLLKADGDNVDENGVGGTSDDLIFDEPIISKNNSRFMDVLPEEHDGANNINVMEIDEQNNAATNQTLNNRG